MTGADDVIRKLDSKRRMTCNSKVHDAPLILQDYNLSEESDNKTSF